MNNKINQSIGCNVTECKFHALHDDFCSLERIKVTHHREPANTVEATDCGSFEARQM